MKKYFILLSLLFLLPFCVNADDSYPYIIKSYNVDISVNENNSFDITETIHVYFNELRHGIIRNIPKKNTIQRADDSVDVNYPLISNISVNDNYSSSSVGNNLELKIGSENSEITGDKTYIIKYNYYIGNDPLKDKDELYFNIIGNYWDTFIEDVSFTIVMPKEFDSSSLGFSTGNFGTVGTSNINYYVEGNVISGSYYGLNPGEGLTVRLELPDGYFISNNGFTYYDLISLIVSLTSLIICFYIWKKYGDDGDVIPTVEFYPPEDMNSFDLAYAYNGKVDGPDCLSLIIYLASKGYLKITDDSKKKKDPSFKLIKIKDYDGDDELEKEFFEGLFKNRKEVTKRNLNDNFNEVVISLIKKKMAKDNRDLYFEKSASNKTALLFSLIVISTVFVVASPLICFKYYNNIFLLILGFFFSLLLLGNVFAPKRLETIYINGKPKKTKNNISMILCLIFGLIIGIICYIFMYNVLRYNIISNIVFITGCTSIIGMNIFLLYLPKRTEYGLEMLGKVEGFKEFLETAEKDKLEDLVEDNPSYFYDILPYTYVLGISDKWIDKFVDINIEPPEWYDSKNDFDIVVFNSFMEDTMFTGGGVVSSSSGMSSSGGGGFSGGGSGGGGGSSW